MTARTTTRLAWSLWGITIALAVTAGIVLFVHPAPAGANQGNGANNVVGIAFILGFAVVGGLLTLKRPGNPIGWLLGATAACYAIGAAGVALQGLPSFSSKLDWLGWIWLFGGGLTAFVLLLFPTGSLPSPRWRPVAWAMGTGLGAWALGNAFGPKIFTSDTPQANPIGIAAPVGNVFVALLVAGLLLMVVGTVCAIASLVFRYRRASSVEREQLKWLLYAAALIIVGQLSSLFVGKLLDSATAATNLENAITTGTIVFVPIAIGIAVFKYRLYDIELVINRTLVYGALAAFITVVYVAIVVGIGALAGGGSQPNVVLSVLATAVVAVAFQPARARAQRLANRLVYGKRATPYEALSEFSDQVGATIATEDLMPRLAAVLAEATGATSTGVWVRSGDELVLEAATPAPTPRFEAGSRIGLAGNQIPPLPGATHVFEVRHRGDLLGALSLSKRPGEALTPTEEKLASQLASQCGLVIRNAGLTEELKAHLQELRASRQRIVTAADEERRRLERNVHDGAQQQLVALAVKARLAEGMVGRDRERVRDLVGQLQSDAGDALENLRDLARGIYPPLLADKGLTAALEAQVRRAAIPVEVESDGVGRYSQETEAAVYFCALEALQNVAKYAEASAVVIRLSDAGGGLEFVVRDDGRGFDSSDTGYGTGLQGMADRLDALGGTLEVRSARGEGTTVVGTLPARALEPLG
ncbi:MAG TPA: histidine kinase [Actinomycetota bacterium]